MSGLTRFNFFWSPLPTDTFVDHKKSTFKEFIDDSCPETQHNVTQRKYRMRDEV